MIEEGGLELLAAFSVRLQVMKTAAEAGLTEAAEMTTEEGRGGDSLICGQKPERLIIYRCLFVYYVHN